ncbi:CU044_2847 family protein [Actinoplanes sp. NPDC048796]|uniref:CU044_2847 family protein n=1 Tax=Actinoplanes sp. NPDC048796 TaxID=3155640 RepID=UPI0033D89508
MRGPLIATEIDGIPLLIEVAAVSGNEPTSVNRLNHLTDVLENANAVVERMAVAAARTAQRVTRRVGSPEQVEVQFGIKFSTQGTVILASANAEASLNVKVIYGRGPTDREFPESATERPADGGKEDERADN